MEKCTAFMLYFNLSLKCILYLIENKVKFCKTDILHCCKRLFIYVKSWNFMNKKTISPVAFSEKTSQLCEIFGIFSHM